nr:hypothetical protein [Pyrinomonadaceae bacterium]
MSKTQNHSSRAGERFAGARGSLWRPAAGAWLPRRGDGWRAAIGGGVAVVVLGVAACLLLAGAWHVRRQALEGLAVERGRVAAGQLVPFERKVRLPLGRREIQFRQSVRDVRAVVRFQDSFFAATGGGLLRLTDAGEIARHYSTLDGLTESDLTSLAVCGAKLFIGTRSQGLLAFDGEQFESYRWPDREPQAVAALLAGPGGGGGGRLLVGTFAGGLLEFDGQSFREIMAAGGDEGQRQRLRAINGLHRDQARLYVGT